jgi:hypothetical protein
MLTRLLASAASALFAAAAAPAHALCTSDGLAQPQAVIERFISADCEACWRDPQSPDAAANAIAIDWVVPGSRGDDAPLSAVASTDAPRRLEALRRQPPATSDAVTSRRQSPALGMRLAQGGVFNDYIGTSVELRQPGREPWNVWLLLVEHLPAGTEGSPVARNLVRNVFQPSWDATRARAPARLLESRAMQIHEGAKPDRLRLVALVQDARGRMRAISQTECRP